MNAVPNCDALLPLLLLLRQVHDESNQAVDATACRDTLLKQPTANFVTECRPKLPLFSAAATSRDELSQAANAELIAQVRAAALYCQISLPLSPVIVKLFINRQRPSASQKVMKCRSEKARSHFCNIFMKLDDVLENLM
jgi:hypothetical protein